MHKMLTIWLIVCASVFTDFAFADDQLSGKPLEIGIIPYLSPRVLITKYEPMRLYLEKELGQPVKIYTATGFKQFFLNAEHGDYDLVLSAAHLARILQIDHNYTALARYAAINHALIVTAKDSQIKTSQDLKGQILAVPDKLSLSSIVVFNYLHGAGLQAGEDFHIQEVPSFASAILSVQKGEAAAAISAPGILAQMPRELRSSVTTLIDAGECLRMVILAHPRMDNKSATLIRQLLIKFSTESEAGKRFIANTMADAIIPVTAQDMNSLDRYIAKTKRLLAESP